MTTIGIVGNGMIIQNAGEAMASCPEWDLRAIVCRPQSREKAERYAAQFHIPKIVTDYDAFLKEEAVDAVYIGIINSQHFAYAKKALLAGRHVICEKPFTLTAEEARELKALAEDQGKLLLEAIHLRYQPWLEAVKKGLKKVGPVKLIRCDYSKVSSRYREYQKGNVLPVFDPELGGGALYDIGVYCVHFADAVMTAAFGAEAEEKPRISYRANRGFNGVDTSGVLILEYPKALAVCSCGKDSDGLCQAVIQGEEGFLLVEDFPRASRVRCFPGGKGEAELLWENPAREANPLAEEFQAFARILKNKDAVQAGKALADSLRVMEILDGALSAE